MQEDFYNGTYRAMFYEKGSASIATKFIHMALEMHPNKKNLSFPKTLEIGGGEGLHFEYVKSGYETYFLSDIRVSPLCPAAENAATEGKLKFILENAESLTLDDSSIDRAIYACVLHHLPNPEIALKESRRVTKSGGMISIYLPCDPGFVYRKFRRLLTGKRARELKIDYELMNVRQHINHHYQLSKLIKEVYKDDLIRVRNFPFQFLSYDFNIFSVYHITINKSE
jgi:phosphatidylethanolamine/phosphatidyl-N-methylethanolamine N-methyltransferase